MVENCMCDLCQDERDAAMEQEHETDRIKVYVRKATILANGKRPWYADYIGRFFWVSRRTFKDGRWNLKFSHTNLTILEEDVHVIPREIRTLFHAWNGELPIIVQA